MREEIRKLLATLRLKGMAQALDAVLDRAEQAGQAPAEVIVRLVQEEHRYRQERSFLYPLKQAKLPYEEWYQLFQRKSLVDAMLDRLKHHCITIRIDGPSLRAPDESASS